MCFATNNIMLNMNDPLSISQNLPSYREMKLSIDELVLKLQTIRLRHALTTRAFEEIIQFVAMVTDSLGGPLGSLYKFDARYNSLTPKEEIKQYFFCSSCYKYYEEAKTPKVCVCGIQLGMGDNRFVYTPLKLSLRCLLQTEETRTNILKFMANPPNGGCADFYGSKRYDDVKAQHYKKHGYEYAFGNVLSFLTFCINIDGVEIFKSSSKSLYPAMISINEMSPSIRSRNIIIPLLFTATKKIPFHPGVMSILIDELVELEISGVDWTYHGTDQNTKFYSGTLCVDAPVKSKLLAIPNHSAKHGCPMANCEGTWLPKGKGGATCWISNESGSLRESDGSESILSRIPALQGVLFKAVALDSLHGIYIGVVKYLIDVIFFDARFANKSTRQDRVNIANKILDSIKAPFFIERGPRNLSDYKKWKAHEWRNMLFFFSVPIMNSLAKEGLISPQIADHWFNLALGTSLLNQEQITESDLVMASEALSLFVKNMGILYGDHCMTYNVHILLHLADTVKYLGPLWATSMFKFEGFNRTIIHSFNGSNCVLEQIAKRLSQRRSIKILQEKVEMINPHSIILDNGLDVRERKRIRYSIVGNCDVKHFVVIRQHFPTLNMVQLRSYKKVQVNSRTFSTFEISQGKNSYIFSSKLQTFGLVEGLYVSTSTGDLYVVFQVIVSAGGNRLPHALFHCQLSDRYACDTLKDCNAAILVPSYSEHDNSFAMCFRLNKFESS